MRARNQFYLSVASAVILAAGACTTASDVSKAPLSLEEETYQGLSFFIETGDPDKAITAFEKAKEEAPDDPDTRVLYAALLMSAGLLDEARAELDAVLVLVPDHPDALYNLALIEGFEGNEELRNTLLARVLAVNPDHPKANAAIGEVHLENKKYALAEKAFAKSLAAEDANLVAQIGYGNVLRQNSKYRESLAALDKAVSLGPDYSFAYLDRAKTKLRMRDVHGAHDDMGTAIERDPEYYWHYIDRGKVRLLEMGNMKTALEDFNKAVEIHPEYFYAYVFRGAIYLEMFDVSRAVEDLMFVYRQKPDYDRIYGQLGSALYMTGDFAAAADIFSLLDGKRAGDYSPKLMQIVSLFRSGKDADAKKMAAASLPKIPRDNLMYHVARSFAENGYEAIAFRTFNDEKYPALKAQAAFYLAQLYELTGKTGLAQTMYLQTADANILELDETRLAKWELKKFGLDY